MSVSTIAQPASHIPEALQIQTIESSLQPPAAAISIDAVDLECCFES